MLTWLLFTDGYKCFLFYLPEHNNLGIANCKTIETFLWIMMTDAHFINISTNKTKTRVIHVVRTCDKNIFEMMMWNITIVRKINSTGRIMSNGNNDKMRHVKHICNTVGVGRKSEKHLLKYTELISFIDFT